MSGFQAVLELPLAWKEPQIGKFRNWLGQSEAIVVNDFPGYLAKQLGPVLTCDLPTADALVRFLDLLKFDFPHGVKLGNQGEVMKRLSQLPRWYIVRHTSGTKAGRSVPLPGQLVRWFVDGRQVDGECGGVCFGRESCNFLLNRGGSTEVKISNL